MTEDFSPCTISPLISSLVEVRAEALKLETHFSPDVAASAAGYRDSARNLLHYVSLRRHDLRDLQGRLSSLGLSSLGRLESYTMAGIHAVLSALCLLAGRPDEAPVQPAPPVDFTTGPRVLDDHAEALLGPARPNRSARIMVTMPHEAATDPQLVRNLLDAGMDVMRINCAHDDAATWAAMVENLRQAERATGRRCRVSFDLSGPKLRTGEIASAARVLKVRPIRDVRGVVQRPAQILVKYGDGSGVPAGVDAVLPVESALLASARPGDVIELTDARQRQRRLRIVACIDHGLIAQTERTIYFFEGMQLKVLRGKEPIAAATVRGLPPIEMPITLHKGDTLILTRDGAPGRPAMLDAQGVAKPATISCTLGESFDDVLPGHRVFFDDGKIGGIVLDNDGARIALRIDQAIACGAKLRSEKGINLPDSNLSTKALTDKDMEDLDFAVKHADMVCLSFVRRPEDVYWLEDELERRGGAHIGIVMKIETRQGFENLPRILLASLRSPPVGVMLARGDLAVEIGFERLAEVQEEILWLCEAAHVPVIWATQVLEGLAKTGAPSRAEVTDAAMGVRAECVMLNKGPYVCEAVRFLDGVLERMRAHQHKKRSMLRQLSVSQMNEIEDGSPSALGMTKVSVT